MWLPFHICVIIIIVIGTHILWDNWLFLLFLFPRSHIKILRPSQAESTESKKHTIITITKLITNNGKTHPKHYIITHTSRRNNRHVYNMTDRIVSHCFRRKLMDPIWEERFVKIGSIIQREFFYLMFGPKN